MDYRKFQAQDFSKLIGLLNLIRRRDNAGEEANEEETKHLFSAPHFAAEENFFLALDGDEIVGLGLQMLRPDTDLVIGDISIHPDYRQSEAAQNLLELSEKRALERLNGSRVSLLFPAPEKKAYLLPLFQSAGYEEIRRSYHMHIALHDPMPTAEFPENYALRPFQKEDARAVFDAFQESFAGHFGEVTKIPFEQWAYPISSPEFDPSLWYVLYHGDEIAAFCTCELTDKDATLGLVEALGVRTKFRKQGLGAALLRHAFQQFQARGFKAVALDVDADNSTNAVALYQAVGMNIKTVTPFYQKTLN
jgi:mycothiol synthase